MGNVAQKSEKSIAGAIKINEKEIGIEQLKQAMPLMWNDQKKMFDIE